jgi:hypothetical protein
MKGCLRLWNYLLIRKNPFSNPLNPLQRPYTAVNLTLRLHIQEAACDPENCSGSQLWCVTLEKSTNNREAKTETNKWQRKKDEIEILMRVSEQYVFIITKLVNVFKGASKNFIPCLFFLFEKVTLKKLRIFSMFFDTFKKFNWRPSPSNDNRRGHRPGRLYASFFKK